MFNRQHFFASYLQHFGRDYEKSLEGFSRDEQVHITDTLLAILECYKKKEIDYDKAQKIHDELFKKYRKRLNNYNNKAPSGYFQKESMKHLDLQYDLGVENKGAGENFLTEYERKKFLSRAEILLKQHKRFLYLQTEEKEDEKSGTKEGKEKFKRERTDKATDLTLEQTSLLAYFLSKSRIILPMGKQYHEIDNAEIGRALAILTRFNPDKLRQCLSEKEINSIADKKNLDAVQNLLQRTIKKIEDKRQQLKEPKKGS